MKYLGIILICLPFIFFILFSCSTKEKEIKKYLSQNEFYFRGKIIDCKSMSIANHLLLIKVDSMSFSRMSPNNKCYIGAVDKEKNIIAFYGRFDYQKQYLETNPILPTYIEVNSSINKVTYDKANSPDTTIICLGVYQNNFKKHLNLIIGNWEWF